MRFEEVLSLFISLFSFKSVLVCLGFHFETVFFEETVLSKIISQLAACSLDIVFKILPRSFSLCRVLVAQVSDAFGDNEQNLFISSLLGIYPSTNHGLYQSHRSHNLYSNLSGFKEKFLPTNLTRRWTRWR